MLVFYLCSKTQQNNLNPILPPPEFGKFDDLSNLWVHLFLSLQLLPPGVVNALLGFKLQLSWSLRSGWGFSETKENFLCFRVQTLSSFAAESGACPRAKKITNHVPIWQINLAVIMPVADHISYTQGCALKKDCLSRWLLRPESLLHTSPRQIRSSQEWIHCTCWRVISPDEIHKVSQLI